MAKEIRNLRSELKNLKFEFNLLQKIDCSKEENKDFIKLKKSGSPLPEGIYEHKGENGDDLGTYYRIWENDLSNDEWKEYLILHQLSYLRSIKNSMFFFVVLTVISLLCSIVLTLKLTA